MAFDAIDTDVSGQIDSKELGTVLRDVAAKMGIHQPTDNDLAAILFELDQDGDDQVSKDEFEFLIIKVLEKIYESEKELIHSIHEEVPMVKRQLDHSELDDQALL